MVKFYYSNRRLVCWAVSKNLHLGGSVEQWLQCVEDSAFRAEVKSDVVANRDHPTAIRTFSYKVGYGPIDDPRYADWGYVLTGVATPGLRGGVVPPPTEPVKAHEVVEVPQPRVEIPSPPPVPTYTLYRSVGAFAPTRSGFIRAIVERLRRKRAESTAAALFAELPLEYPQGAPLKLTVIQKMGMVRYQSWKLWYDTSDARISGHYKGVSPFPPPPPPPKPLTFREKLAAACSRQVSGRIFSFQTSLGLNMAQTCRVAIPSISICCASSRGTDGRTTGGQTVAQEADPLYHRVASNTAPARQAWISERRQAIRRREQANSLQSLAAQTDQPVTFEQARNAYLGAAEMIDQGLPLLPPLRNAYAPRGLWRGPSTRANYTLDFRLSGIPTGENTLEILYNPVADEEMDEYRDRGMSAVVIDALEIAINPFGMPGNPTDLTVVATYGHERNVERAFIGSASTFLGNGLSRAIFFPGLQYSQEEPRRESIIRLYVASTNATVDADSVLAAISVGTLRQHIGSLHNRTVANSVHNAQVRGTTLRAAMMGNTIVVSPEGGLVTGAPNANVTIGGSSSVRMVGPLAWENVQEPGRQFTIQSRSRSVRVDRNADLPEAQPRTSTTTRGLAGRGSVQVPKDCKAGAFLKTLNLRDMISGFSGIQYEKWIAAGLVMPDFKVVIRYPANAFTGLTWVMSFDAYNRITSSITTTASPTYTLSVPHWLLHHKNGTTTCEVDYGKLCGHAMWFSTTTFETPKLHFTCLTGNNKALAADWEFVVELYAEFEAADSFLGKPNFVHRNGAFEGSFEYFTLPPLNYALNTIAAYKSIPLNLGQTLSDGTSKVYNFNNTLLSYYLGLGGKLRGRVLFCSPIFYGVVLRIVSEWNGVTNNWNQLFKYPGVNLEQEGPFEIEIRSPFHRTPMRLQGTQTASSMSSINMYAVSGPIAPGGETADMAVVVQIDEIALPDLSAPAFPNDFFLWVDFSAFTIDQEEFVVGSRFFDFTSTTCTVALGTNPFAHMIACHGLHRGVLELKLEWSLVEEFGKSTGSVILTHLVGDKATGLDGGSRVCAIQDMGCLTELFVGNFAGPNPNTALDAYSRWLAIKLDKARSMKILRVLCRPKGDFEFYGRTCFKV
uniref:Polyprotein P2 123kDa n=1 Tax=Arabis mosaic virus TaxID=12271 RepID=A0A9J6_ARMV|nr:polyprotein P2 123KDa [Arabis mosaic virus]